MRYLVSFCVWHAMREVAQSRWVIGAEGKDCAITCSDAKLVCSDAANAEVAPRDQVDFGVDFATQYCGGGIWESEEYDQGTMPTTEWYQYDGFADDMCYYAPLDAWWTKPNSDFAPWTCGIFGGRTQKAICCCLEAGVTENYGLHCPLPISLTAPPSPAMEMSPSPAMEMSPSPAMEMSPSPAMEMSPSPSGRCTKSHRIPKAIAQEFNAKRCVKGGA